MKKIVEFARELGVDLYPGQAESITEYYESGVPNWLFLAGRRSGKSLLSDVIACYEAVVPDFSDMLRPGETRYIIVVSVRQDTARLHITNIGKLLRASTALGKLIINLTRDRIELSNGVTILSLPASGRAGRGYTASTVIMDELSHFQDGDGNSSADAVFDAFSPVIATFGDMGRLVVTTTPAARTGIVFDLYDRQLPDFFITHKKTKELNPTVTDNFLKRMFRRSAASAATEYDAEFADPIAAFFEGDTVDRAIDKRRKQVERAEPGHSYVMAIDPATMRDRYAMVICHRDGDLIVLDHTVLIKPPINHEEAEQIVADLNERFHPVSIRCDTSSTAIRLKQKIFQMEYLPFTRPTKLRMYGILKEAFNLGNVVLFNDKDLIAELKVLQIKNGVDIHAPTRGTVKHDDLADCLAMCADALASGVNTVSKMPNLFYEYEGLTMDDFIQVGDRWEFLPEANKNAHPPGITYHNCRKRNKGCDACVAELTIEGFYKKQEAELKPTPISREEAQRRIRIATGREYQNIGDQDEQQKKFRILNRLGKAIDLRLAGGDEGHPGSTD